MQMSMMELKKHILHLSAIIIGPLEKNCYHNRSIGKKILNIDFSKEIICSNNSTNINCTYGRLTSLDAKCNNKTACIRIGPCHCRTKHAMTILTFL